MNFSYKQIWLINYPVMMSVLTEQLINITDAVFLGRVGEVELGASALAGIYYLAIYMLGFGFSLGIQVMVARRNGERKYNETGKIFFQGLFFLTLLAAVLFVLSRWLTPMLLQELIASPEIQQAATDYLDWRCSGLLFAFPALAFRSFFVGLTRTRVLTVSALATVVVNLILNYLLIFGKGGFPAWGISGAAIASSLSELASLLVFIIYTAVRIRKQDYGLVPVYDRPLLAQLFNLSVWSMLYAFICVAPWFLFFVAIEHLGQAQLAIANIVRSISTLFFVIVSSFSSTTGSLVSNLIGAGNSKNVFPLCRKTIFMSYAAGLPLILAALFYSDNIFGFYTANPQLVQGAFWPFAVMLLNYAWSVPAHIYCNAVTGTGNTRIAFAIETATIVIYLAYLYAITTLPHVPLAVYWTAEHLYTLLLLLFSGFYLRKGNWKTKVV